MLFPIPWVIWTKQVKTPPMWVLVCINPKKLGARFNPCKVALWKKDSEKLYPTEMYVPFDYATPSTLEETNKIIPIKVVDLKQNTFSCIRLIFDVVPFSVTDKVFVEVSGLEIDGKPYPLPIITFEKAKKFETIVLP